MSQREWRKGRAEAAGEVEEEPSLLEGPGRMGRAAQPQR